MSTAPQSVVTQVITSLQQIDIPPILQERIDQHQKHLTSLASALLAGGQDTDQVRHTIEEVLESFKSELLRTIDSLMEDPNAL